MFFFKILYAPLFFTISIVSGLTLIAWARPLHELLVLGVVMVVISFISEQIAPYEADWNHDKGDRGRDFLHALVNESSVALSVLILPIMTGLFSFTGMWPTQWPLWAQLGVAIIIADIGITLAHYASHRSQLLWRLHAPHHSVTRMYGFNGLLKHPAHQAIELLAGTTPLILLGMPIEIAALLSLAVATQLLLQHSNVDMKIGTLRYIWAVAPLHRFHHINKADEGDVNFGLFLTLWDRLLGTAYFDETRIFASSDLGIENERDYPSSYIAQLIKPFK